MAKRNKEIAQEQKLTIQSLSQEQENNKNLASEIARLLHMGKKQTYIKEMLMDGTLDKGVKYSFSQATNLVVSVKRQIESEFREAKEGISADIFDKLNNLYELAYSAKDFKECREILRDIGKLIGIGQNQINIARDKSSEVIQINFGFND